MAIFTLLIFLSGNLEFPQKTDYAILFSKIDNQAKVYIEDSLIFESKVYEGNPELKLRFSLTDYLKPGFNTLRVELFNGSETATLKPDKGWQIYYEIFENEFPIDYVAEKDDNGKQGLVFSMTHEIEVY